MNRSDGIDTQVRAGANRPGRQERSAEGLTAKVLAERLTKPWAAVPPATERCWMGRAEVGGQHRLRRPGAGSGGASANVPTAPVVLSGGEVKAVRQWLGAESGLVVGLLYGSGLRLMDALRLRVKDLDVELRELTVRDGKGGKDRRTLLPESLIPEQQDHLLRVRRLHQDDLSAGWGRVLMPYALARKYPNAERGAEGCEKGRGRGWSDQGRQLPYVSPFLVAPPRWPSAR